jgi:transcriptional regulator with XRE-family HTH domain
MELQNLGKIIRLKRTENNLASGEAAKILDVTPAYYSRLENGKEKPSPDLLGKIAEKYHLPIEDQRLLSQLAGYATGVGSDMGNTAVPDAKMPGVQVKVNAESLPVLFSDSMFITVSENGVVFDFAQQLGPTAEQQIVARVGVSHGHARKIRDLLDKQLKNNPIEN